MPIIRGSTHGLYNIKETVFGTTPATPNMRETPFNSLGMRHAHSPLRSGQMRSHPFLDRLLAGRKIHELNLSFELQGANHDNYLETVFGANWSSDVIEYADALKSMTLESRTGSPSSKFNQFTGAYFNRIDVACSANDTAPVLVTLAGMARVGTLDAASTVASANTAASDVDPWTFVDAVLEVDDVEADVVSGNFTIERAVDPLMIWGSRVPREYVAGAVTMTGTLMVPYDDGTVSAAWDAFGDTKLEFIFNNAALDENRTWTFHRARYLSLGRTVDTRAGLMQEVNWEAMYDPGEGTGVTLTREDTTP